jgi:hypothetical protein
MLRGLARPRRPARSSADGCGTPSFFGLLNGRLLDERLRLAVQVSRLGCQGGGHGSQQCRSSNELLDRSPGRVWLVDVEVDVNALASLLA